MNTRNYSKEPYSILCFGDSNTWGCIPMWEESAEVSARYPWGVRWTSILQENLGYRARGIEEGLGGRTTLRELPKPNGEGKLKVAEPFLPVCLLTNRPVDMVILMLGTNDLHLPICPTEETLGEGVRKLIHIIDEEKKAWNGDKRPQVLLIAPPRLEKAKGRTGLWRNFGENGLQLSEQFGETYRRVALEEQVDFLDAGAYIRPSEADGIHLTAEAHFVLGEEITKKVEEILEREQISLAISPK